jgi:Outer membrane protein beta-barrel domain
MKTTIFALSLFLLSVCNAFAQEAQQMRVGIKAGVNFSSLNTKNDANSKMITGYDLGVFTKMPIAPMLAIQPELNFTTKGSAVSYNNLVANGTANFHLNYLELPILLVINPSPNFNVHFGPYASYLLSVNTTNDSNVQLFNFENELKVNDFNRFDLGIAAGLGVDIGAISIGGRFNLGLLKVGKERTILGSKYTIPDAKNSVLNLYASISLN